MGLTTLFAAFLIVFTVVFNLFLEWSRHQKKRFPWCRRCGCQMYATPLVKELVPEEVQGHLVRHNLPYLVVNRYVCPRGHSQMWHVPRLGTAAKGVMVVRDM
jgi:hypothetical protein